MWFGKLFIMRTFRPSRRRIRFANYPLLRSSCLRLNVRSARSIQSEQTLANQSFATGGKPLTLAAIAKYSSKLDYLARCAREYICTVCSGWMQWSKLLTPKLRQYQSFVSIEHHAHRPAVDEEEQRAALEVADLLHIGGADEAVQVDVLVLDPADVFVWQLL